jgi:hypothetical protein
VLQTNDIALNSHPNRQRSTSNEPTAIESPDPSPRELGRPLERVSNHPHHVIYRVIVALALWFVLSAWMFFGSGNHMGLILAVVCVLFIMAIGVPYTLWRVGKSAPRSETTDQPAESFATWTKSEFATWIGHQKSATAAIEIMLPFAAVAVGITALGIVFDWAAR